MTTRETPTRAQIDSLTRRRQAARVAAGKPFNIEHPDALALIASGLATAPESETTDACVI